MTNRSADIREAEARGILEAARYIRKYWMSHRLMSRQMDAEKTIKGLEAYAAVKKSVDN